MTDQNTDCQILGSFITKNQTLYQQYASACVFRKAYMAKNWDELTKMIDRHLRIVFENSRVKTKMKRGYSKNKYEPEYFPNI